MVSIFVDAERVGPQLQQTTLSIRTWANFREEKKHDGILFYQQQQENFP